MYGFFKGTFNKKNGKFSYDKVFRSGDNALEFRYASYLTQRLSMEPELRGLTPSQIQALQWFHTKAGKGPYPEIEAKTDKGLIANYAADNPDLRTGTLESALKFAEFEIADFMEIMKSDAGDDVRFPAANVTIPSFNHGPGNYQQGQAIARDFGGRFENEGSRIQLISKPNMSSPGLVSPEGMTEFQTDSMFRGIIEAVTETDGSIRILNDMGLPHMVPLTGKQCVACRWFLWSAASQAQKRPASSVLCLALARSSPAWLPLSLLRKATPSRFASSERTARR